MTDPSPPFPYGAHERCVFRPVRRESDSRFDADEYDAHIRVECLDCGFVSQGHGQAVSEVFHRNPCDKNPCCYWRE